MLEQLLFYGGCLLVWWYFHSTAGEQRRRTLNVLQASFRSYCLRHEMGAVPVYEAMREAYIAALPPPPAGEEKIG